MNEKQTITNYYVSLQKKLFEKFNDDSITSDEYITMSDGLFKVHKLLVID